MQKESLQNARMWNTGSLGLLGSQKVPLRKLLWSTKMTYKGTKISLKVQILRVCPQVDSEGTRLPSQRGSGDQRWGLGRSSDPQKLLPSQRGRVWLGLPRALDAVPGSCVCRTW